MFPVIVLHRLVDLRYLDFLQAVGVDAKQDLQKDTSIIRANGPPLGKTNGFGDVDAASAISTFMGGTSGSTGATAAGSTAAGAPATTKRGIFSRGLLSGLLGGAGNNAGGTGKNAGGASSGTTSTGTKTPDGTVESGIAAAAGKGATSGLPTVADDGTLTMTLHQVYFIPPVQPYEY